MMTAIPLPPKATALFFYKYCNLAKPENLERLRVIIQEHELYLPNLDQLNDPATSKNRAGGKYKLGDAFRDACDEDDNLQRCQKLWIRSGCCSLPLPGG